MPHGRCKSAHNGDAETSSSAVSVLCLFLFDVVCSLYTVKHKKNLTFYFWLQLWLILTNFYSFYIILIVKNSTCDCSKIYHITLIVCTPYFVNLNNNTKQLKRYYSLFIYIHSKREQKKTSPATKLQCCHFDIVILRVAVMFKMPAFSVDTGWQTTPALVDGVVHNRLVQQTITHLLRCLLYTSDAADE